MQYSRKPMTVDAMKLSVHVTVDGEQGNPGDYLVTFPDGSQAVYPPDLFSLEYEVAQSLPPAPPQAQAQAPTVALSRIDPVKPEDWQEENLPVEVSCIECGQALKPQDWDRNSGIGKCCIPIKCPTCKRPTKLKDLAGGQYCPNCLPALAGRRDR